MRKSDSVSFKNGIYSFDGVGATKLNLDIDSLFEGVTNERCSGAYLDNKYYLACKLNFGDGETVGCESGAYSNNALIELDLVSGNLNIVRGVDIVSMTAVSEGYISKLICCFGGDHKNRIGELVHDGAIFGTPLKKAWISPKSDFGYADKKKLSKNQPCDQSEHESQDKDRKRHKNFGLWGKRQTANKTTQCCRQAN